MFWAKIMNIYMGKESIQQYCFLLDLGCTHLKGERSHHILQWFSHKGWTDSMWWISWLCPAVNQYCSHRNIPTESAGLVPQTEQIWYTVLHKHLLSNVAKSRLLTSSDFCYEMKDKAVQFHLQAKLQCTRITYSSYTRDCLFLI